ncbi:MAG: hypothetical protein DDT36_01661 [Firmicutes bacterium]|nr:hypothetical protein [Bacillota bacterium]MBT9161084.1 hypothetical protein [Chloroflexota bacterium]
MTDRSKNNRFRLFHRRLNDFCVVDAPSAQEACARFGWVIEDVWARMRVRSHDRHHWVNITPQHLQHTAKEEDSHD